MFPVKRIEPISTQNLEPRTPNPEPRTPNPEPWNPEPWNPEPWNPEPRTLLFDCDPHGRQSGQQPFDNLVELDKVPDQFFSTVLKIGFELQQLACATSPFFDIPAQTQHRGPGEVIPEETGPVEFEGFLVSLIIVTLSKPIHPERVVNENIIKRVQADDLCTQRGCDQATGRLQGVRRA